MNMQQYYMEVARFLAQVPLLDATEDVCVEWPGRLDDHGYGALYFRGKMTRAHVVAYLIAYSLTSIPNKLFVLHTCDNPPCCNLLHLYLGTQMQNVHDAMDRGRKAVGERMPNAKLTAMAAQEICRMYANGISYKRIADEFGVAPSRVYDVVRGRGWKHLHLGYVPPRGHTAGEEHYCAKLNAASVLKMRELYGRSGWSFPKLASCFGVNTATAYAAVRGITWKQVPLVA